ncbi:unnamed protein product [Fusarium graminearum]|uniref:Uncharacterized protein n=1 Tax=Gibberella zeae TaxID=5518 RepID=A0A4E9DSR0_GIBZA|nr:unnamed protein product [Fusarium graminearum]CAF3647687.1 unnamed protein product [Fusarium graminearum]CAG1960580.1 unnamed protein product [Fusarium graminearum]CAG1973902.1 unnamed protein product [Fusarium graminearum]
MKIESILNQFNELDTEPRTSRESTQQDSAQWERRDSSFLSSTPPPESTQSRTSSVRSDSRTRTPWDAGGYSLPRDNISTPSSRSPFSTVSWGEQQESQRLQNVPNNAIRNVSMDASASYTLPVRRKHGMHELGLKLTVFQEEWLLLQMSIKMHGLQKGAP